MAYLITYSEHDLLESLGRMAAWQRALFAASCAERQFPVYDLFVERYRTGDRRAVRAALDCLWLWAREQGGDQSAIERYIAACDEQTPRSSEYRDALVDYAQDAISSVIYGLQALGTSDPQFAVWAGQVAYRAADATVALRDGVDFNVNRPEAEQAVLRSDLVQVELHHQAEDLELVRQMADMPRPRLVREVEEMKVRSSSAGDLLKAQVAQLSLTTKKEPPNCH